MGEIIKSIVYACSVSFLAAAIIIFPDQSFEASIRGLNLWLEIVLPSLLPFFIVSELLLAFGVVQLIGVLLEPMMRPLFNVPGSGGVVLGMGMASGYPAGAKFTSNLRKSKVLTRIEAERLVSFTNASNPLFIFGAISIGFFHDPKAGLLLAAAHYIAAILVGLTMRFYRGRHSSLNREHKIGFFERLTASWKSLHHTRLEQSQPLGQILGQAVMSSLQTLCLIGGFIVLFSVINKLLFLTGVTKWFSSIISVIFEAFTLPSELTLPFLAGIFEITLGSQMISQADTELLHQFIFVSAILAFNGFSIQAQVASILAQTDIRFLPYFIGRILHVIYAVTLTWIFFRPLYLERELFSPSATPVDSEAKLNLYEFWVMRWIEFYAPIITVIAVGYACIYIFFQLKKTW
ncbi:sporulation integral membrane protein YlbJ [Halalkalibacillus sediminis]|uniref:Sporulation integral membrane protein YlbJ n=1 Tax=Halalkalibacillus sediminis TaxID=2018042 RepID=A0A2I0QW20_9BACI|nr:sporulation integral membrane protein YlbJ [Halalkalibacillus sediminis]PKR78518.1 sporulation integral membrane protein YlbJ [Halalkalibacillus sediminis]